MANYLDDSGQSITDPTVKSASPASTNIPSGSYNPVAKAPDGVQVYQNGSNYYTHNADGSFTQQYQGGAPDWLTNPTAAATPAAPATGGTGRDRAAAYFASKGVTPFATSLDTWDNYWNQWGKNDPAYFDQRLSQADEFTGVGPNYDWQAAGKADPGTSAGGGGAVSAAPAGTMSSGGTVTAQESEFTKYLRDLIKSRLGAASQPVDPNAQNIAAPLTAARDEATRASDKERTDVAERLYAQGGLNTNALNQTIQQSSERNAGALSTLRGTLIMNAYNQKNQELQSLLQMALASGDAQSAREVQAQMSNLQAQLQREGLGVTLAINSANQNANTVNAGLGA